MAGVVPPVPGFTMINGTGKTTLPPQPKGKTHLSLPKRPNAQKADRNWQIAKTAPLAGR
jgi:hypothetical protein